MINLTNSFDHPTRPGHTVFRFYEKKKAAFFEQLLAENNIWFEADVDQEEDKTIFFYGVKNADLKSVNNSNYLVSAKFRKPFIPNVFFKWSILVIAFFVVTLALIGFIRS